MLARAINRASVVHCPNAFSTCAQALSAREKDILELIVKGLLKKGIADQLALSDHTVDNHLRSIYQKLHVHSRSSAVAKALSARLF